jgi:two-component system heavy metal sensor histidine kinase CusS
MSSKSVPEKLRRPWSLAARLSAWYAGSAFLLLLVATGFLYWALVKNFDHEDDQYLTEKINVLSTLLRERPGVTAILDWEVESESTARPYMRVLTRVLGADGRVIVETKGMSAELALSVFPAPSARVGQVGEGVEVRSAGGRTFRLLSARAVAGPPKQENCLVQAALDTTYEENLVAEYRQRLWLVLGAGLVACALIGYGIARHGIRPVQEISASMRRIRSETLNQRIASAGLPAELSALAATFNEMLDRLEEAFARLSRFSSDIAHELRTPINNLRGEVEVALSRARTPEEYREALGSSLEECLRLSRMIDNLLFLARAENPQTKICREPVDVARELGAVREFYDAAAGEAGVKLDLNAPDAIRADLDRTLFQQSIGNLIENALAHTPRGGVIQLSAAEHDGNVLVSVSDSGCGIPEEDLPRVCERFYRADRARSKHTGGVGLGLAIVKSIAALHGGDIRIASTPGRGTRVTLSFPQTR